MRKPLLALVALSCLAACGDPTSTVKTTAEPEVRRKATNTGPVSTPRPSGLSPYALTWKQTLPKEIRVTMTESTVGGESSFAFTYDPDPPDAVVELAPAPGTSSFELTSVELTWVYSVEGEKETFGPEKLPIAPVQVAGAPTDQEGPAFRVQIPLNMQYLKPLFTDPVKAKRISRAAANLTFFANGTQKIYARNTATPLSVPISVVLN